MTPPRVPAPDPPGRGIALGSAIVALIEPHPGHARAFNTWYERDHLYAVGTMAPWTLAGARFVATRDLKALRIPRPNLLVDPPEAGSFLSLLWVQDRRLHQQQRWVGDQMQRLERQGRVFAERDHVASARFAYRGGCFRDAQGVPAELALDHRYAGVVCAWVERRNDTTLEGLCEWYFERYWMQHLPGSPIAMVLGFELLANPEWWPPAIPAPDGVGERMLFLHFLEDDPAACWSERFEPLPAELEGSRRGRLLLAAPFAAIRPGSDDFVDEL